MNKKGFYSKLIAALVATMAVSMLLFQATETKTTKEQSLEQAIFELKNGSQQVEYLLERATADAMSDCYDSTSCAQKAECLDSGFWFTFAPKLNAYYAAITTTITGNSTFAEKNFGIKCKTSTIPITYTGGALEFDLNCSKQIGEGIAIDYNKTAKINKEPMNWGCGGMPSNPSYPVSQTIQINNNQTGFCDVLIVEGIARQLSTCYYGP